MNLIENSSVLIFARSTEFLNFFQLNIVSILFNQNSFTSQYCEHNTSKRMRVVNSQSIDFSDENTFIP